MKNELEHLVEFQEIIANYKLSETAKKQLSRGKFVILTAPTSAGRNTLISELVKLDKYRFLISDTTRKPRINNGVLEQDGEVYFFKSEEEVLNKLRKNEYVAPAIIHSQQVSAIGIDEIKKTYDENRIPITEIEVQGVEELYKDKPDLVTIFVIPPSFEKWMARIKSRGDISLEDFKHRLKSAINEFSYALKDEKLYFVVNDDLSSAVREIATLIDGVDNSRELRVKYLEQISELKKQTENLLSTLD